MPLLPPEGAAVSPSLTAAVLLAAISFCEALGLPHPTAAQVLAATGASKTRAYELRAALLALLPTLLRPPGRPRGAEPSAVDTGAITRAVLDYVAGHPGAIDSTGPRHRYSDGYRGLVLDLAARHADLDVVALAEAVRVPVPTLRDWLGGRVPEPAPPKPDPVVPQIETVIEAWQRWEGSLTAFWQHARHHLHLPFGITHLREILELYGVRKPKRRPGRSPDEKALRGRLVRFFPGAQWVEDGTPIPVRVGEETFTFNVELCVDAATGAFTGASVRDTEDGRAVVEAFEDGVATTGAPPLAVSMDNRHSNHTEEVEAALGDTLKIRATQGRPQNDAPAEGAFGLFQQTAPPIVLPTGDSRELARCVLALFVATWGRLFNHRPRRDHGGRSRVELYRQDAPTPEQIAAARAALAERQGRQERARRTREARLDPVVRAMLDDAFVRLGLDDPTGNVKDAIAGHPMGAGLAGIAIFEGKRRAGTLPDGAGAHYLLGIVRNVASEDEGMAISEEHWRLRLAARDRALVALDDRRRGTPGGAHARILAFVDLAMATDRLLDRAFWLRAVADVIEAAPTAARDALHRLAARRIHATHRVHWRERQAADRRLVEHLLPI